MVVFDVVIHNILRRNKCLLNFLFIYLFMGMDNLLHCSWNEWDCYDANQFHHYFHIEISIRNSLLSFFELEEEEAHMESSDILYCNKLNFQNHDFVYQGQGSTKVSNWNKPILCNQMYDLRQIPKLVRNINKIFQEILILKAFLR